MFKNIKSKPHENTIDYEKKKILYLTQKFIKLESPNQMNYNFKKKSVSEFDGLFKRRVT